MRCLLLVFGALAVAQEPMRVSTRLIETNVVVRDARGPVVDLTAGTFKIFEDGKEQRIAVFRVSKAPAEAVKVAPAGVYSNRIGGAAWVVRYKVLLIDTLNTNFADQALIRSRMIKMFDGMEIRDPMAIYAMGGEFHVLQDFTTDAGKLKAAMEAFRPEQSRALEMAGTPTPYMPKEKMAGGADVVTRAAFQELRAAGDARREEMTVSAFEQLALYLARVPGRKTLVWVSSGFPSRFLHGQTERWRALERADAAVYPVDATGLTTVFNRPVAINDPIDSFKWIAEETGGRAIYNRNDIDAEVREALEDGDVSYTLGFYEERGKADGKFHELKVKVDRPGVEVRSRTGYFDEESKTADGDPMTLLRHLADAPTEAREIGLTGAMARAGANFQVAVLVDFKDLRLVQSDGRWKGSANVAFVSQGAEGRALDLASKEMQFDMTEEAYRARCREGLAIEQAVPVRAGVTRIRVVVADESETAGSVSIAVH